MEDAPQEPHNTHHFVFCHVHTISGIISNDQTGRFPVASNWGHAYVVIFYIFDANYIRLVPIKNRSKEELLQVYHETYDWLVQRGFNPQLYKLDNEIRPLPTYSPPVHPPPNMHRTNPAE
jgi:hypothetical protein